MRRLSSDVDECRKSLTDIRCYHHGADDNEGGVEDGEDGDDDDVSAILMSATKVFVGWLGN